MRIICSILIIFCVTGCKDSKAPVARYEDYERYISSTQLVSDESFNEEVKFWNSRLAKNGKDEASLSKLAGLYAELFKKTNKVGHLLLSDSLNREILKQYPHGNAEIYQRLAANAITQHKFQEAKKYAEKALSLKEKEAASLLLLVDVSIEIGDLAKANQILRKFRNKNSFAYLIRKAKVYDHEGLLDSAIVCMEKAYERIKGNRVLGQWALSNLGDMYGHAGRIEKAYQTYLNVLKNNPSDDHALQGIAWICLSDDKNFEAAKRIINALSIRRHMPEAHLMYAEIAEMEGDERLKLKHLKKFRQLVSDPAYKIMYHKYLALLEAEEFNPEVAVSIATKEIDNRPAPASYDLLAWAYYHQKDFIKAFKVAKSQVENQTFEPDAIYHLGMIYLANGDKSQAKHYLEEALESEFELGPSVSAAIKKALKSL
jgi:tetratricopeptide (TPR) repeat protein